MTALPKFGSAICIACGVVLVAFERTNVVEFDGADAWSFEFDCAKCGRTNATPIHLRTADILRLCGAFHCIHTVVPGSAISHDEVLDAHEMTDADFAAGIAELLADDG